MIHPEGWDDVSNFLPNLYDVMKPQDLTHKDAVWCWDDLQKKVWNDVKNPIVSAPAIEVLEIQCDSRQSGLWLERF